MGNEARDVKELVVIGDESKYSGSNLPVTEADFTALSDQRKMLKQFVAKQLVLDVDYGIIPGTPKPSLYKPGAEKILKLFGLGVRYKNVVKEIDRTLNYASFDYTAEIYHLKSGYVIAECEANCNSQEKKYRERQEWKQLKPYPAKKEPVTVPTLISDIQNTLMKMCQKRALVGGAILACGASDFFSQDLEDMDEGARGQDIQDANAEPLTPEQEREKAINGLIKNLKLIGVSETMIRTKYKLDAKDPFTKLTREQCQELDGIGAKIHGKQTTVKEQFPLVNFADGVGQK